MRAAFSKVRVPDQRPLLPSYDNERGMASGLPVATDGLLAASPGRKVRAYPQRSPNTAFRRGRGGGNGLSDTTILKTYLRPFARAASTRASHAFPLNRRRHAAAPSAQDLGNRVYGPSSQGKMDKQPRNLVEWHMGRMPCRASTAEFESRAAIATDWHGF